VSRVHCPTALYAHALSVCLRAEGYRAIWLAGFVVVTDSLPETLGHAMAFASQVGAA
jgi:hypothetical protein